ncbi:phosphatidylglycerol lysyltransferase [Abditibacterium utsteinense]|uniref:Phosphatidylglycerol lysyltransferase n=1 Tax=Abditibacterium utsteinense TaxID=1960156 RepID=A0A2S8SS24_9BACT|nr:DUF2156 domain-containing protein [Abditibacterium utsteinense]PQV63576.1 phosphatidylglycerol lysyltransferase [Abditibacterium utsteinense]
MPHTNLQSPSARRARDLVMRFGWNAVSYQILNPGMRWWFSRRHEAVIGFVLRDGVRVVAGAPICDESELLLVLEEWEECARKSGEQICYFGAAGRLHEVLNTQSGCSTVTLGAQPVWGAGDWTREFASNKSLRAQISRARNKGVRIEEWPAQKARGNRELAAILAQWLHSRGLPSLHFLVEPQTLDFLGDRRLFVAVRHDKPVGFVVLAPIPRRNGFLTEQFVRGIGAPNGVIESLLLEAITQVEREGAQYITMGLVPLSILGGREENPFWLGLLLTWMRAHGRRFYNFGGLETFKSKFHPRSWEPIYAISNRPEFSPAMLYAVAGAFTRRPVWLALWLGLRRALRQEVRWKKAKNSAPQS